ncbi:MAG: hypothetical protein ACUVRS_01070 [Armatimonadota bacterium]
MKSEFTDLPEWVKGCGRDVDVVISTRARLARNLAAYPFPWRASKDELDSTAREVRNACTKLARKFPGLKTYSLEKLTLVQKSFLVDARLASTEQVCSGSGRVLLVEPSGVLSIMVNEEDHIRLQVIRSGLATREAWEVADWADDVLATELDFAFSPVFGYLTAHVSNVGTGLRISVLMHLAGLALMGELNRYLRAAYELAVSIRGCFGEASAPAGHLYQVSNEITCGIPETEIVERVTTVAEYLLVREREARKKLLETKCSQLTMDAEESLKHLSNSMSLGVADSLGWISKFRLGCALGLLPHCSLQVSNELLLAVQAMAGDGVASIDRAKTMRSILRICL